MTARGLLVEAHCLQGPRRHRGIGRYVACLIEELHAQGALTAALFNPVLGPPPMADVAVPAAAWRPNTRRERERLMRGDVHYLVTSPFETGAGAGAALPVDVDDLGLVGAIVYDLIPFLFPDEYLRDPVERARHEAHAAVLRRCSLLLAISDATRRDVIDVLGRQPHDVVNISAGLPRGFGPADPTTVLAAEVQRAVRDITRPFVLCVGAYEWRKNVPGLIEAWALLDEAIRRRTQLVVACDLPDGARREWTEIAHDHGVAGSVVLTGHTDDATLRVLYQAARLFVFPSRYEGFGFPPLEAMASGTPTLVAGNSSLLELSGPEARFDVDDVTGLASLVQRALTDDGYRAALVERGRAVVAAHTWERTARRVVDAFDHASDRATDHASGHASRRLAVRPPGVRGRARPRLAIVGPFSPARTGVGVYDTRLAARLHVRAELDCFVDGEWHDSDTAGATRLPISLLGSQRQPHDYDSVLYVLGNSRYHIQTFDRLVELGGVAWMHDVNLTGLHRVRAEQDPQRGPADSMAHAFERSYGPRARRPRQLLDHDAVARDGFFMTGEVTRAASSVIVSSTIAATLLEIDAVGRLARRPAVLPLAFPDVPRSLPATGARRRRPTVVSMGNLHEVKRPHVLLEAMAMLPATDRPLLVFAGADEQRDKVAFADRVLELGLTDDVLVTGWLAEHEYWRWLNEADVVVQLRALSYGESSATVTEAMACGKVVVTSVEACADLPGGVHVQVPNGVDASSLAAVLGGLVSDRRRRSDIGAAARDHAASWTFDRVAAALIDLSLGSA